MIRRPRAALVPRLPWAGLLMGLWPSAEEQKCCEISGDKDDGIDMMVESTDEDGNGIGKGLCLQLKAGNCRLGHQTE